MGLQFAHVVAKCATNVICMRRIREMLGEERTDKNLKELSERKKSRRQSRSCLRPVDAGQ